MKGERGRITRKLSSRFLIVVRNRIWEREDRENEINAEEENGYKEED